MVCTPRSAGRNVRTPKSSCARAPPPAIWRDGTRRTSTPTWGAAREPLDVREQRVHRGFVGADDDAAAPHLLQLLHGRLGLVGEAEQALGVSWQHRAGLGQRAVPGRPVEQPLAQPVLETPDRLADGRLGAVQLAGGRGEAPLGSDGEERGEVRQLHKRRTNELSKK